MTTGLNRSYERTIALAMEDGTYEDHTVAKAEQVPPDALQDVPSVLRAWEVHFREGFIFFVRDEYGFSPVPEPGMKLRLYGEGFGRTVRGVALVDESRNVHHVGGNVRHVYRYRTLEEERAEHAAWVASEKRKKIESWEAKKTETARAVAALPAPFRERFDFFLRRQGWGPEFGPYELFVMQEAVKIAQVRVDELTGVEAVAVFSKLSSAAQRQWLPSLDDGHSGNTFGAACALAHAYLTDPKLVLQMHGALCPLVGCQEYGCWSTTQPVKEKRT